MQSTGAALTKDELNYHGTEGFPHETHYFRMENNFSAGKTMSVRRKTIFPLEKHCRTKGKACFPYGKSFFAGKKDVGPTERHVFRMETHFSPGKMSVQRKGMLSAWKTIFRWKKGRSNGKACLEGCGVENLGFGVGNRGFWG